MTALVVIVFVSAVISEIATSSRQLWSFARDGGLPFSRWVAKVGRIQYQQHVSDRLTVFLDQPKREHPVERDLRLPSHRDPRLSHQPRVHGRAKRHQLRHHLRTHVLIYPHHRLRPLPTPQWAAPARTTLVARPSRHADKHCQSGVPASAICLRLLPACNAGHAKLDELGSCDVWRGGSWCDDLLCCGGSEELHTSCGIATEGSLRDVDYP